MQHVSQSTSSARFLQSGGRPPVPTRREPEPGKWSNWLNELGGAPSPPNTNGAILCPIAYRCSAVVFSTLCSVTYFVHFRAYTLRTLSTLMAASSSLVTALILLVVLLVAAVGYSEAYGEPSSTRPSYQERTFASLVNAARVGTHQIPAFALSFPSPLHHTTIFFITAPRPIPISVAFLGFRVVRSFEATNGKQE